MFAYAAGRQRKVLEMLAIIINRSSLEITLFYTFDSIALLNRLQRITGLFRYSTNEENGEIGPSARINMRNRARQAFWSLRDRCWKCRKEKCARKTFVEKLRSFVPFARLPIADGVYVDSRHRLDVSNARILLKKSEIEVPRKSHFRAESVVSTGGCLSKG